MDFSNRQSGNEKLDLVPRVLVLSVGSFAVGTGTFVVTGVLTDIAEDLSVSVANAGLLVTVFAFCGWGLLSNLAVFAFFPLQQYRLIELAPEGPSTVLSLNPSAIQAGQGLGARLGALALHYGSVSGLGWEHCAQQGLSPPSVFGAYLRLPDGLDFRPAPVQWTYRAAR